jgi:hypothetical protein
MGINLKLTCLPQFLGERTRLLLSSLVGAKHIDAGSQLASTQQPYPPAQAPPMSGRSLFPVLGQSRSLYLLEESLTFRPLNEQFPWLEIPLGNIRASSIVNRLKRLQVLP